LGPSKFTTAIEKFCKKKPKQVLLERKCEGKDVIIFNSTLLGPFEGAYFNNYLTDVTEENYKKQTENAVAFHLFNKLSAETKLSVRSKSLYVRAARDFCPISLAFCNETF
jgi:N-acetylneuraminic acid mutarotase